MYEEYRRRCLDGTFRLGDVMVWAASDRTVFNLGTQRTWRTTADLAAIERAVEAMLRLAEEHGIDAIGVPRIGTGLGGLEWQVVETSLRRLVDTSPVRLIVASRPAASIPGASFTSRENNRHPES